MDKKKFILGDPDIEILEKRRIQSERIIGIIKKVICQKFKVDESYFFQGKRKTANVARLMALLLSKELSGLKLSELGIHFGFANYRTVGTHCWRFHKKLKKDKGLEKIYSSLIKIRSQEKT